MGTPCSANNYSKPGSNSSHKISCYNNFVHNNNYIFYTFISGSYSGDGSVDSNSSYSSGVHTVTVDEASGFGSSSGTKCPLDFQVVTECLPSRVCEGSASVERVFVTEFSHPDELSCRNSWNSSDTVTVITEQREQSIQMNDECIVTEPYMYVQLTTSYSII